MRLLRLLMSAVLLVSFTACEPEEAPMMSYPELTTLDDTMWYSYDAKRDIYYDIYYNADGEGRTTLRSAMKKRCLLTVRLPTTIHVRRRMLMLLSM